MTYCTSDVYKLHSDSEQSAIVVVLSVLFNYKHCIHLIVYLYYDAVPFIAELICTIVCYGNHACHFLS